MAKVRRFENVSGEFHGWGHYCPGCKCYHVFDNRWKFNGDVNNPSFTPSMCVNCKEVKPEPPRTHRCHYILTNGEIKYLIDCTHELKNKTIKMENDD